MVLLGLLRCWKPALLHQLAVLLCEEPVAAASAAWISCFLGQETPVDVLDPVAVVVAAARVAVFGVAAATPVCQLVHAGRVAVAAVVGVAVAVAVTVVSVAAALLAVAATVVCAAAAADAAVVIACVCNVLVVVQTMHVAVAVLAVPVAAAVEA